ncbi:hypothetical protein [Streptomyces neyagawaensis]|uniref:Integral membrane protein n=1 Tax=Streptomyces neyagawaensis TaxID=42238 RepID=A0ABV3AW65_9ACTN
MRDPSHGVPGTPEALTSEVWTGRATNRAQWLLALGGAAFMALGIELAVDSAWTSGTAPLVMSVVGCIAAGLLVLFGTLAFVHVSVRVDGECLEVRCGHIGVPRRRIPLSQVTDVDFAPCAHQSRRSSSSPAGSSDSASSPRASATAATTRGSSMVRAAVSRVPPKPASLTATLTT